MYSSTDLPPLNSTSRVSNTKRSNLANNLLSENKSSFVGSNLSKISFRKQNNERNMNLAKSKPKPSHTKNFSLPSLPKIKESIKTESFHPNHKRYISLVVFY